MSPGSLLLVYSALLIGASLLGGWLPGRWRMTHTRTQMIMSFVSGMMLGVAIFHLLPHSIALAGDTKHVDTIASWLLIGLVTIFLLLRTFHFHQHDFDDGEHDHGDDHDHNRNHNNSHDHAQATSAPHQLSWTGLVLGMGLHSFIDGIALGAAMLAGAGLAGAGHGPTASTLGLGVFLAIVLHKPLDALSVTSLLRASGWSSRACTLVNICFSLLCPLGALLFFWGVDAWFADQPLVIACALAFSAGVFLCISLSDLLPEVQFHSHDRLSLTLALLLGIGLAWLIGLSEPDALHGIGDGSVGGGYNGIVMEDSKQFS